MAITLVNTYTASQGRNTTSLTFTVTGTTAGDVLVFKGGTETGGTKLNAPTTTGETWSNWLNVGTTSSTASGRIDTAVLASGGTKTVTVTMPASASHSGVVEHWTSAQLAATPATASTTNGGSAPSLTLTTVANGSVVSWASFDWNAVAHSTITYRSSATGEFSAGTAGSDYFAAFAYQAAATAGSQTFGMTAPTGQQPVMVGIEIQAASGGSTPVSLTGVVADLALGSPAGTVATQTNVAQTGVVANLATSAPAGTVSTQTNVSLTGVVAPLSTSSPAGTVATQKNVTLTGVVANLATAAPAGTVSTGGSVSLTGTVANLATTAPAGTVATQNGVVLSGPVATLTTSAPAGSVSLGGNVNLTGTVAALTLTAPAGTVGTQRNVALSGPVSAVTLAAIAGTVATQQVVALTGAVAGLTLTAPAGTFSAQGANDGSPVRNPRAALTTPTSAATITGTVGQATLTTPTSRGTLT